MAHDIVHKQSPPEAQVWSQTKSKHVIRSRRLLELLYMFRARQGLQLMHRIGKRRSFVLPSVAYPSWRQGSNEIPKCFSSATSTLPPFYPGPSGSLTEPPNPGWKYGEGYRASVGGEEWAKGAVEGWKSVDTSSTSPRHAVT